jgi:hypothetical protein
VDASEWMALLFSFGRPLAMEDSLTHVNKGGGVEFDNETLKRKFEGSS